MTAYPGPDMGALPRGLKTRKYAISHQFLLSRHADSAITRGPLRRPGAHSFMKRTA